MDTIAYVKPRRGQAIGVRCEKDVAEVLLARLEASVTDVEVSGICRAEPQKAISIADMEADAVDALRSQRPV